jgi:hypothetical protein
VLSGRVVYADQQCVGPLRPGYSGVNDREDPGEDGEQEAADRSAAHGEPEFGPAGRRVGMVVSTVAMALSWMT